MSPDSTVGNTEMQGTPVSIKVPNSPSSAFATLSLDDFHIDTSCSSESSQTHVKDMEASTVLVKALDEARNRPKPLIRSTGHIVPRSAPEEGHHHLLSWKVAEFAYRKSASVGAELPTLARGLFTERVNTPENEPQRHRIVVRGYDKFFNLDEMPWTRSASIATHTTGPYVMTFKENGCIIFVSSLSSSQLLVTSKHSLGSIEGTGVTHAQMGEQWLHRHLSSVGKTSQQLAAELWRRDETAAFELCDDSFEEHVLEYSSERSGLHLHGLNANTVHFFTRSMTEVDDFAKTWGFIPTRWIEIQTLEEVQSVTAQIEQTGAWEGEPIEGFVIRTHMPPTPIDREGVVSPPYSAGQAWFYKVKFDEPYLMYRDWRELTRKMLSQKTAWEAQLHTQSAPTPHQILPPPAANQIEIAQEEPLSKAAKKREQKRLAQEAAQAAAALRTEAQNAGVLPPDMPQAKSKRPETRLYIQWCYDRLYGNSERKVKPQPALFASLAQNKGIIAMRNAFLQYMETPAGQNHLLELGGASASGSTEQVSTPAADDRPFTKTILAPIAVPGCGKTILAVALTHLFPSLVGHVQSDDFKSKKGFLAAIEKDLRGHATQDGYVLYADKNNHLFQHRDELCELTARLSLPAKPQDHGKKRREPIPIGRIRTVALAYDVDALPLNTLHRICASRIESRGSNHQTLRADTSPHSVAGLKTHEQILWRFLEGLQPFQSSLGGEGAQGWGDAKFDDIVQLKLAKTPRQNLEVLLQALCPLLNWTMPDSDKIDAALECASEWKVEAKPSSITSAAPSKATEPEEAKAPRYYGIAVELDIRAVLDHFFSANTRDSEGYELAKAFYATVREGGRLNLRPHITLVHSSNLSSAAELSGTEEQRARADRKWDFYSKLVAKDTANDYVFELTLTQILYERDSLLTFPVQLLALAHTDVAGQETLAEFEELNGDLTPHITIATRDNEVRPYRANQVIHNYFANSSTDANIVALSLPHPVKVQGRVFGMA